MSACPVPGFGLRTLLTLALVLLISGCSTSDIDRIPQELGGLPAGAPARPAEAPAYPAVNDMPARRPAVLDAEQQKKLEADLIAVRNRQPNQQKNIARDKAAAEKAAKAKAAKENQEAKRARSRSGGAAVAQPAAAGQTAPGAPPWPLPPQTTSGSVRP